MAVVPPPVPLQEITEFIQQLVSIPSVESKQTLATCVAETICWNDCRRSHLALFLLRNQKLPVTDEAEVGIPKIINSSIKP